MKILIVDDDNAIRELIVSSVKCLGHETVDTNDPRMALRLYRTAEVPFDLVITDFHMPVWSGLTLALQVRAVSTALEIVSTPILCISGAWEDVVRFNKRDGSPINRVLAKPFRLVELETAINELTAKAKGQHA